jgi:hypothetical protein
MLKIEKKGFILFIKKLKSLIILLDFTRKHICKGVGEYVAKYLSRKPQN